MKYYIKQGFLPFVYVLFMAMTAFGILVINGLIWLKALLAVLNVGLYAVVVSAVSYKEGQEAMKALYANDLERMEIIRTGEDRPLKIHEEYKPWKGFMFGFIACVPLLILLVLHTIMHFAGSDYVGLGAIAGIIYLMFFIFFRLNIAITGVEGETVAPVSWYTYYGALIALPIVMLITGISYILGARKIRLQHEMIEENKRRIYGEEN